mmetsp:Transcript_16601/g.28269  ORF Transcript_16601/g.28269 Transcript_16601/m.28269 type:complete len:101 (+) Transcript_16601:332-634(+)
MLRTLQTTVGLFREHPNKHAIRFILQPLCKESLYMNNDLMQGPFKQQIYDIYSNKDHPATGGLHFDFTYVFGAYGCESTMQFSALADVERLKLPFAFIKH